MQNKGLYYASIFILQLDSPLASMSRCVWTNQGGGGRAVEIIAYI